jgi:AraC-like DNA-binding protein
VSTPFYTILYLLDGRGTFVDQHGRNWALRPGDLVQRFPDTRHSVYRERHDQWAEFYVTLPGSLYRALLAIGTINPRQAVLHPGLTRMTYGRLRAAMDNMRHDSGVSAAQVLAETHALLVHLFDMARERRASTDESTMVRRAREVLGRDLELRVPMVSVAEELGVGYERFRKAFRRHQGVSPKEYRIRRRIDLARHVLSAEQSGMKEVAFRLGYPDVASFVKQFRRVAGVTPARFRRLGW